MKSCLLICILTVQVKVWAASPGGDLLENPVPLKILMVDRNDHKPAFTQPVFYGSVPELSPKDAGGPSSTATVEITLVETNDFAPRLSTLSGSICKTGGRFCSGLVLTAEDEDLPPHADPFSFEIPAEMPMTNWAVTKVNGTGAVLQPGVGLPLGVYLVTVMVSDSGTPPLHSTAQVSVTLCECDSSGNCLDSGLGAGLIALITIATVTPVLLMLARMVYRAVTTRGEYNFQPTEVDNPMVLLKFTCLDEGDHP